jgi:methionyl-tRNA synthetase
MKTRIITAALPFANNNPHLGHLVGSHLPADIFARYSRLKGYKVYFVGGTDENGAAIEFAAYKEQKTPKEICDKYYESHKKLYAKMNISYDNFSRTSRDVHHKIVQDFFLNLYNNGFIKEKQYNQPFCNQCKKGLADRFIKGVCPSCGYEGCNGDQCESCGTVIEPIELKDPFCAMCGSKDVSFNLTNHLFLDLTTVVSKIDDWITNHPLIRQQVKNLAKGWIKQGIKERCITRSLSWGVKVPLKGYEDKVFYVWFDNVIGYISSTVELLGQKGLEIWKDKETETYYFLGKDNIPFHTIFWPGQIIGEKSFHLPTNVLGYQYLNFEKTKFSKSKGTGIFLDSPIIDKIPIDYWRFYLTYILTETKDAEFMLVDFKERINKELIGNFGNYVNRVLDFVYNKLNGKVPEITTKDENIEEKIKDLIETIDHQYNICDIRYALYNILKLSDLGNKYLNEKEPWKTKDYSSLGYSVEIIRILSVLMSPVIPNSSEKILSFLNTENKSLDLSYSVKTIKKPEILFKKLEDSDLVL